MATSSYYLPMHTNCLPVDLCYIYIRIHQLLTIIQYLGIFLRNLGYIRILHMNVTCRFRKYQIFLKHPYQFWQILVSYEMYSQYFEILPRYNREKCEISALSRDFLYNLFHLQERLQIMFVNSMSPVGGFRSKGMKVL